MADTPKLNPEQIRAIKHGDGPLLIIAGAGTGKTTVITERVKYLISKKLAKPEEILALTFTEKAAREMEERIDRALPYGYTQMWVMTFHSFCDRILRREALHIGLDSKFKLMTSSDMTQLIKSNLFEFDLDYFRPLGNPTKFISGMLQHFSRLQDENISPEDYLDWVSKKIKKQNKQTSDEEKIENSKWLELASAYKKYEELKIKGSLLDFGDLIVKTINLFEKRPNILASYQKQFKYILIDEFQDTNFAQNELALLLSGKHKNITVVGDDDQSVYRFRGAAVSNILQFRKNFPKAKVIVLTTNYRSGQEILDSAYKLIQNNNPDRLEVVEKVNKKLVAVKKKSSSVEFIHVDRVENEAEKVVTTIKELVESGDYDFGDFAVLVRANNHSEPFIKSFQRHALPYQFLGPGRLFKQPVIIDLISYLRVLNNFEDSVSFYKVLSSEFFDVSGMDMATLGNYARKNNVSLFEAADKSDSENIKKVVDLVKKHIEFVKTETAGQILYFFLEESGALAKLINPDGEDSQKKASNVSKFFDKLKSYEVDHEDASVSSVIDWIDLASEVGESPLATDSDWSEENSINILTVHSAKGLEFPVVFLVNLVSQRFPTTERREQIPIPEELIKEILPKGDYHEEEERRLFYVGMTRAKDKLFLTAANYYGEAKREKKLSPFIFESLGEKSEVAVETDSKANQMSFLDYEKSEVKEKEKGVVPLKIDYLSYSQIETFKVCPLHYKLKYLFKIPTPPSASQSFGISMHNTLKDFYEAVKSNEKPTEKLLVDLLTKNWIVEGYSNKVHEKKFFARGKTYLSGFLKEAFDPKVLPVLLEEPFTIPVGDIKIGGKIDRVDSLPDGSIEIWDYKTGATIPTPKEVKDNLQLSFYALAASTLKNPPFDKDPKKIKLSLYYLDTQEKFTTRRTLADLEKAKEEILKIRSEIENSDFTCSGGFLCKNCEFKQLCSSEE